MKTRPQHLQAETAERLEALQPDVQRLPDHGKALHPGKKIRPIPHQRIRDEQEALTESLSDHISWDVGCETGEELVYLRDGMQSMTLRKLRRGHWVVQGAMDLHGHTTIEARAALAGFLHVCLNKGLRCVRVVHGKGHGSPGREPVLKGRVRRWLVQKNEVLAFVQARASDGGAGCVGTNGL